jgi:hypothetical protein
VIAHTLHNGLQIIVPHFGNFKESPHKAGEPLPALPLEVFVPSTALFLLGIYIATTIQDKPAVVSEAPANAKPQTVP